MIKLDNVSFAYKDSPPIFKDFSLSVNRGELYGLLGPNGAGKTSLISLITGQNKPLDGSISVGEKYYPSDRKTILSSLALVPQEYAFYPQLTAMENLLFFSGLYGGCQKTSKERIDRAIELTGLRGYEQKRSKAFSGGLKRRLNLAIGLLNQPSLLILDEPTVGIDPQSRRFILEAIQTLNQQGTTVLYTSHYMEEIEKICTQIAIIDQGKILLEGSIENVLTDSCPMIISTTTALNSITLSDKLKSFLSSHDIQIKDKSFYTNHIDSKHLPALLELLEAENITPTQIKSGKQRLEDIFFNLTKTQLRDS